MTDGAYVDISNCNSLKMDLRPRQFHWIRVLSTVEKYYFGGSMGERDLSDCEHIISMPLNVLHSYTLLCREQLCCYM